MLDLNYIREHTAAVAHMLQQRGSPNNLAAILELDRQRRTLLTTAEDLKAERNRVSQEIGRLPATDAARAEKVAAMRSVGDRISMLDEQLRSVEAALRSALLEQPNVLEADTPPGTSDDDNVLVKQSGPVPQLGFAALPHWELGERLGLIDFVRGTKLSGPRFYVLNGAAARLQRALIAFMLDLHQRQGYAERYVPFMVRQQNFEGAGQLPKFADNIYHDAEDDAWFVTTAEVPLTNLHRDEILDAALLPLNYCAYSPCFRREKVAAGRDVRGIKRGHQFDKVEMYMYTLPEHSAAALQQMLADAEQTLAELGLTYRVRRLCSGDVGFAARSTLDLEVWAPGCGEWLEVSSCSNCGDFQARRANLRFRRTPGAKPEWLHTLNGSGLGLPRTLIAVMENYQQPDGSIAVPPVLQPWMGGLQVIR